MQSSIYALKSTLKELGLALNRTWIIKVGDRKVWNGKLGGNVMLIQINDTIVSGTPRAERENHDELIQAVISDLRTIGFERL